MSGATPAPRLRTVEVDGGPMTVGEWGPEDGTTVLAVHGITASLAGWSLLAAALPEVRLVAPDLRGRGRSNALPGPYGLDRHAGDLERLLDGLGLDRVAVVGHSMGAFVGVRLAGRVPDRVSALVLVDGGLALPPMPAPAPGARPEDVLGPAAQRLTMTFADRAAYHDFWRAHPAFAGAWGPAVEAYVDHDLEGEEPYLTPSTRVEALATDIQQLAGGPAHEAGWTALRERGTPVTFLRAPRGLMDEPGGLYPPDAAAGVADSVPQLRAVEVDDVNHYTVLLGERGADAVATATRAVLDR
ncbi:alpha/beta fold hydrolase [Nocardioides sp. AX2bis]|uniref:alpha/beta fold hydrolase n=1 Tax=Nocardioides sp. AX2bis TaxID=2653157 RepID=UPI00135C7EB1|nr:alpha/beta hydrolase [Nocardioides sp. AX2bis]